jgi:predicted nucleotidyltransferase
VARWRPDEEEDVAELTRESLEQAVRRKIPRPLHATLVGDHLHGWASERSTYIVSGAMLIPVRELLGLRPARETKERTISVEGRDVELRFHDMRRFLDDVARLANTKALEDLFSPYIVFGGTELEQLRRVARGFLTRNCYHDYLERGVVHRKRVLDGETSKVWELLEAARLFLGGAHVLRTGEIDSHLPTLVERGDAQWLKAFIHRQQIHGEAALLSPDEAKLLRYDLEALEMRLHSAHDNSVLPEGAGSITTLDEMLIDLRLRDMEDERARRS